MSYSNYLKSLHVVNVVLFLEKRTSDPDLTPRLDRPPRPLLGSAHSVLSKREEERDVYSDAIKAGHQTVGFFAFIRSELLVAKSLRACA
jgi:hypothetical protein